MCVSKGMCCKGSLQREKGLSLLSRWGFIVVAVGQEDTERGDRDRRPQERWRGDWTVTHVSVQGGGGILLTSPL